MDALHCSCPSKLHHYSTVRGGNSLVHARSDILLPQVLCDASGKRLPAIRENIRRKIGEVYKDLDITLETYPPGERSAT